MPTNGFNGPDTFVNEDAPPPGDEPPVEVVAEGDVAEPKVKNGVFELELPDGSLLIDFSGGRSKKPTGKAAHDANLAEYLDLTELGRISNDLLDGINADIESRREWLERRASGMKHLALKLENPRSPSADADTVVEGQSTVRWPGMLDAVMRFQANARAELLPAAGPVKIRNDSGRSQAQLQMEAAQNPPTRDDSDDLADALERDLNHYLTVTDKPYYSDTTRMFFMQGFGGSAFKKVYYDPIQRRPLSRTVDAEDVIVGNSEVSLHDCGRVTHRLKMRQSTFRRMELDGVYKEWPDDLTPEMPEADAAERAKDDIGGFSTPYSQRAADYQHTIYECYCELDIEGFEHKQSGQVTGLPLPYRVTIEKGSQKILEIRRNWKEDDDRYLPRMPLVKFPFVEGLSFYGIGLLDIMGNTTAAVSAAWRLALDSAGFSSWPGFLYADTVGRQDTMSFRVGLGAGVRVNTSGQDIRSAVMPLPYKDVTTGLVQMMQHIEEEARRVGGTPEIMVGEGRADVPVGTTLAMIDQAQKVLDAVHKGMHSAQSEEFSLLRDLFIEYPDTLHCNNPVPARQWEMKQLVAALTNCNLTPQADPNTPSHTMRVMKAVALVQLVQLAPDTWKIPDVSRRVAQMIGLGSVDSLLAPPSQGQDQGDPVKMAMAQAKMADVQAKMADIAARTKDTAQKLQLQALDTQLKLVLEQMKVQDQAQERASRERIEATRQETERLQLTETALIHPQSIPYASPFMPQTAPPRRIL